MHSSWRVSFPLQPEEFESVHSHTFRLKTFKKGKHCGVCKQTVNNEGLICRGQSRAGWASWGGLAPETSTRWKRKSVLEQIAGLAAAHGVQSESFLTWLLNLLDDRWKCVALYPPLTAAGGLRVCDVRFIWHHCLCQAHNTARETFGHEVFIMALWLV